MGSSNASFDRRGAGTFEADAADVLSGLRIAIANVLSSLGGVRKPADLQKLLKLEWTLSWHVFQIAGATGDESSVLSVGGKVPSRSALKRFLEASAARGVSPEKVSRVWAAFERFENLVQTHAGDRISFLSMISAAAGINSEWLAADQQHRRNAFRAMSHAAGMQALTKHKCVIYSQPDHDRTWDLCVVAGYVGLRFLRPLENTAVFQLRHDGSQTAGEGSRVVGEPLRSDQAVGNGYLLPEFSTSPLPKLRNYESDSGWQVTELERPAVGSQGATTLRIAAAYRGSGSPQTGEHRFSNRVTVDKPVEVLISDILIKPGLMLGMIPKAEVWIGNAQASLGPVNTLPVVGNHRVEFLGRGPDILATPDVPDYPNLMRAAAERFGCGIDQYEAWRLRLEFPFYQSDAVMTWELSDAEVVPASPQGNLILEAEEAGV